MRLVIHEQLDITDEERVRMANVLDEKISKRQATRDEMKQYIWSNGKEWLTHLDIQWGVLFGGDDEEDLLGDVESELESLL